MCLLLVFVKDLLLVFIFLPYLVWVYPIMIVEPDFSSDKCINFDKESACKAGDTGDVGSIPESGRSPGGGNDNPCQYSCLKNPMDRGAWWATALRAAGSDTHIVFF